jgi:hypothetical protein
VLTCSLDISRSLIASAHIVYRRFTFLFDTLRINAQVPHNIARFMFARHSMPRERIAPRRRKGESSMRFLE